MDAQRKALQALTVSLDERRQELQESYAKFGETIFSDSANPSVPGVAVSGERRDSWRELMSSRERDAASVLEIGTAVTRRREIEQFRKELSSIAASLEREYSERLAEAGKIIYENYDDDYAPWFSAAYEKATAEGSALVELESRREALRKELEDTGFLGKMVSQLRMTGISAGVRRQRERVSGILADGARAFVEGEGVEAIRASGKIGEELVAALDAVVETRERVRSLEERARAVDFEFDASSRTLEAHGAEGNPSRRMDELGSRIRDADRRIETLCALAARDYCDRFMDESGVPLAAMGNGPSAFGEAGAYSRQIEAASFLRREISGIRRSIESLETAIKIDSLERGMVVMRKNLADCERKIEGLETQAAATREAIASASAEHEGLMARKAEIDKTMA